MNVCETQALGDLIGRFDESLENFKLSLTSLAFPYSFFSLQFLWKFLWKMAVNGGTLNVGKKIESYFCSFCDRRVNGMQSQQDLYNDVRVKDLPDSALAQQAIAGDKQAFESLVRRYQVPLFNFIYRLMGDPEESSDLLQEVFLRFYTSLSSLHANKPFKPWLFQVAHNCCIDALRQRRRHVVPFSLIETEGDDDDLSLLDAIPDNTLPVEDMIAHHDLQKALQSAISALPVKFRAVVTLRYTSNLRFSDIGRILNMPEQTAKTYFNRAKVSLRKSLSSDVLALR
jgi:RNA polymerase sigma factor, sigma-70 family